MIKINWWEAEYITFPRHMIVTDDGLKNELGRPLMVFGVQGNKCNTIYGDYTTGSLRLPSRKELAFISNATGGKALTEDEHKIMAIWRDEEQQNVRITK